MFVSRSLASDGSTRHNTVMFKQSEIYKELQIQIELNTSIFLMLCCDHPFLIGLN
jgi:hypothetical protein